MTVVSFEAMKAAKAMETKALDTEARDLNEVETEMIRAMEAMKANVMNVLKLMESAA
jgi:hypothetical protein